jgi:glycosyltransferase involved in cell wall biosynthesis
MEPAVSVLMPVYNGAGFVGKAADSILGQTLRDLELIIIDDGSTDNTWKVLEKLAERDSRVNIYRNESNVGIPGTSNRAISLARGQFIARQDADDWSYPTGQVPGET